MKRFLKKAASWCKRNKLFLVYFFGIYVIPAALYAWTSPQAGSFAYDVYDIAIKKIAEGPIGFVAGAASLAGAIFAATRSAWVMSGTLAIGAGLIYKLDSIAQSLGFTI